jgi:5-methyltetrahydrofolate--homocysteine methyltransferase
MQLEFKPDFDQVRQRWDSLWKGVNTRPLALMVLPKAGVKAAEPPRYMAWFDGPFEPVIDQLLAWAQTHEFLGESIPFFCLHFGADTMAGYLGGDLKLADDEGNSGSWAVPFIEDLDRTEIRFRKDGYWWKRTVEFGQALRQRCDGKLLIAGPPLAANLDVLAAMRGSQNLLMDLVMCPDAVKRALDAICRAHTEIIQALAELLDWDSLGSMNNEGAYVSGRQSRPQCDFSCMISEEMFREFAIPCLQSEGNDADAFVYHLDGPGAIRHVPALCELDALDLVCYVPGQPGQPGRERETNLGENIDELGKGQMCLFHPNREKITFGWKPDDILRARQAFKSRKLVFQADVSSKAQAEDLLGELDRL